MVEIGIGGAAEDIGGRSLLAWRAYFPFATILACDIRDRSALATPRVEILRLDQGEGVALQGLAAKGPFDIIVDDGSHLNAHQLLTFAALFDSLAEGGLYVVEDVQTSFWHRVVDGVDWGGAAFGQAAFSTTCMGHFLALAAHLNYAEFLDPGDADPMLLPMARRIRCIAFEHNLIFVTKGRNEALSNTVGAGDGPR